MKIISGVFITTLLLLSINVNFTLSVPAETGLPVFDNKITTALFELFVNLFKYLHYSLDESSAFFQRVLQDETIIQSNITEQSKAQFKNYISEALERNKPLPTNITALDGFFYMLAQINTINEFEDIVNYYNNNAMETHASDEYKIIQMALQRNGLETLVKDLKIRKMEFLNEFLEKMKIYKETLSEEERQKATKLVDWYENYIEETDEEKANDVFTDFVQMFVNFGN